MAMEAALSRRGKMTNPSLPGLLDKFLLIQKALRDRRLGRSRTPSAVLACLIEHDGQAGCFPGGAKIATWCGVDSSRVDEALKRLKRCGYIDWRRRKNTATGHFFSNLYRIHYLPQKEPHEMQDHEEEFALLGLEQLIAYYFPQHDGAALDIAEFILEKLRSQKGDEAASPALWREVRKGEDSQTGKEHLGWWVQEFLSQTGP